MSVKLLWKLGVVMTSMLALASCMSTTSGTQSTHNSGIEGLVDIGPVDAISPINSTKSTKPYIATLSIQSAGNQLEVKRVTSGADGKFRIPLAPGNYHIVPLAPNPGAPPYAESVDVHVSAGKFISITITYDSGIR
jgi:hypothetical protein